MPGTILCTALSDDSGDDWLRSAGDSQESGNTTPSSDETQIADHKVPADSWNNSGNDCTHHRTITFQATGDPARILKAIKQAGLENVVLIESHGSEVELSSPWEIENVANGSKPKVPVSKFVEVSCHTSESADQNERSYFKTSMQDLIWGRSAVLILLLVLQSASSVVLSSYQQLIERNVFLALFLTMLTGTGGNAGNQSSALVIRGLSTGEINQHNMLSVLFREVMASSVIALVLAAAAFSRVLVTDGCDTTAAAIVSSSTYVTVVGAIAGGTAVPMVLDRLGLDPCNLSSPILATITDVMGVLLLCVVTTALVGVM